MIRQTGGPHALLTWDTTSGVSIRISSYGEWTVYNEIFVDGDYDAAIDRAIETASHDRRLQVLDLGANLGFFALRFVDQLRRSSNPGQFTITLIEADARLMGELHLRLFTENDLSGQARIIHGLAGDRYGAATLYEENHRVCNSIFPVAARSGPRVQYVDLDALFAVEPEIDLLKCDIEGAELLFVRTYPELMRKTRVAVFEMHDNLCDTELCRRLLREAGFQHHAALNRAKSIYCVWR